MLFIAEQCLQTVFCGINRQFRKKYTSGISRKYLSSYSRRKLNSKMTSVLLEMPSRGIKSVFSAIRMFRGVKYIVPIPIHILLV